MDVKSVFLNDTIKKKVYIEQLSSFEDHKFFYHVFKLNKILYGLKHAPKAWYESLSKFLIKNGFKQKNVDITLFFKKRR